MTLQYKKYLDDILYAIELIEEFISNINSYSEYSDDKKTSSAVERQLSIIGEAVNKFDKSNPNINLKHVSQIVGFRNRIIHAYNSVDDSVVWAIIKKHIPILKEEIINLLNE